MFGVGPGVILGGLVSTLSWPFMLGMGQGGGVVSTVGITKRVESFVNIFHSLEPFQNRV